MTSAKAPDIRLRHILDQIDGIVAATRGKDVGEIRGNVLYEKVATVPLPLLHPVIVRMLEDLDAHPR